MTTHGFLTNRRIQDFLPSNFTPEEWQRHCEAHPSTRPSDSPRTSPSSPLDPLTVASLDPYRQRSLSASTAVEEFLAVPPPMSANTIDTTDLERTLQLSAQYESQLKILRESSFIFPLQGGREGMRGINNTFYPVPTLAEIRSALAEPHLREKVAQGFTRLLLVPFALSLDALRETYKNTLLTVDSSPGLKDASGNAVPLDRAKPLWTWEEYNDADHAGKILYGPEEFSAN
ncbi:hypothetical protein HYW11_00450, partial [Candidatus Peregrinibacteria bacterium]|nr:hypothetical protein [Candidatus Peregrinibacteria bacterium]